MTPTLRDSEAIQTLDQLPIGATLTVLRVRGESALHRRLMDMGLVAGVQHRLRGMRT